MIVNGKEYNIDDLVKQINFASTSYKKIGNMNLMQREIEILNKNGIDYNRCNSISDLILYIESILDDEDIDTDDANELDWVLENLAERNYYENTNK